MHTCNGCGRHLAPHRGKRRSCSIQCANAAAWWHNKDKRRLENEQKFGLSAQTNKRFGVVPLVPL